MKRILVACEYSGRVRDAFRKLGHDAWSCDLLPAETPSPYHLQCDVRDVLDQGWDMLIGFPDCTFVCGSGIHWNDRGRGWERTEAAVDFFRMLWEFPIRHIALENPIGILSKRICKPTQIIQPHQFGDDASKATCLWLKNLPSLSPTCHVPPRIVGGKNRWANQTDSGQNRLGPSEDRWKERSRTYQGIADAMADQWDLHISV
jgi:hypothetical protein